MTRRNNIFVLLAVALSFSLGHSAFAIDAASLTDIIRNANILKYDKSPKVTISGAQITTSVDPMGPPGKTSDQDLKIDALLLAKSLYDAAPQELNSCKIIFSNGGKDARYTIISRQKVSEYSSGSVNAQELLGSLALTLVVQESQPEVVEGPFYERRILVWERIENLRKQGTGVKPFEHLYTEVESSIKANDDQKTIFNKLTSLEEKLSGQETQIAQAKKVAQGKGIHGNVASSSASAKGSGPAAKFLSAIDESKMDNVFSAKRYVDAYMQHTQEVLCSRKDTEGYRQATQMCQDMKNLFSSKDIPNFLRRAQDFKRLVNEKQIPAPTMANLQH
ncbi:MAG: hypothetical protein KIT34_13610 [Cyanobacteria bacterium TGS_CYA1]|nr:hypothetical protein [Cyanobacteria bacterium TGS_CYA1]